MSEKDDARPGYDKRVQACKDLRKAFEQQCKELEAHTRKLMRNILVHLRSDGPYNTNGYFYIADHDDRKAVYTPPAKKLEAGLAHIAIQSKNGKKPSPSDRAKEYTFEFDDNGKRTNFLTPNRPYKRQGHHLLPCGCVKAKKFSKEQWQILQKLPYDINHGENVILLPKDINYSPVHKLPHHNTGHKSYNSQVQTDMDQLKTQLKKADCDNPKAPPIAVVDKMIGYQEDYWNAVVKDGQAGTYAMNAIQLRQKAAATNEAG